MRSTTRFLAILALGLGGFAGHDALAAAFPPAPLPSAGYETNSLTPAESLWYARLVTGMNASQQLVNNTMSSGDSYSIGRDGGNYVEALVLAYRATGNRMLLDRVLELTELARAQLRDAWLDGTTDGFTDWLWLADPTNPTYYGKDTNWLDESIASGNVALWACTFQRYRTLDTRYAVAADFWRGWLETQFLAKWYQRAGGDSLAAWHTPYLAFYKPDLEPRSANWRLAHYLYVLGGNPFYRDRANAIAAELAGAQTLNPARPTAYRWPRQCDPASQEWQLVNYANYYMRVIFEMRLEGQTPFPSTVDMKRFASTFRDVIYPAALPALATMPNDVSGGGSRTYALYVFNGFAPWDSTGSLMNLASRSIAGSYAGGGLSKAGRDDAFISAYALMGLALAPPSTDVPEAPVAPPVLRLGPGQPNPFSGSTRIAFELTTPAHVRFAVYDATGALVRLLENREFGVGHHSVQWDGTTGRGTVAPDGVYWVAAESGPNREVRKLLRLR
jgi:hypothetical protein